MEPVQGLYKIVIIERASNPHPRFAAIITTPKDGTLMCPFQDDVDRAIETAFRFIPKDSEDRSKYTVNIIPENRGAQR